MAYQNTYANDIFVSYAWVDNAKVMGSEIGWVTAFVSDLEIQLSRKLGRSENLEVWRDKQELQGNVGIRDELINQVRNSAVMLVILSKGYVSSPWCERESKEFWESCLKRNNKIFIVEIDESDKSNFIPYKSENRPAGYKFYKKDPDSRNSMTIGYPTPTKEDQKIYFDKINDIVSEIEKELTAVDNRRIVVTGPTIFLAEVTDDLENKRSEVLRFLTQEGFNVIPQEWGVHQDLASYTLWLEEKLSTSVMFVQLLSEIAGKKPFGKSFSQIQFECASKKLPLKILQWKSLDLKPELISDREHARLVNGPNVQAISIENFKSSVIAKIKQAQKPEPNPAFLRAGFKLVYVSVDKIDRPHVEKIIDDYANINNLQFVFPEKDDTSIENYRKWQEAALNSCDVALLTYLHTEPSSVIHQVKQLTKILPFRETPPDPVLFDGPPAKKEDLPVRLTFRQIRSRTLPPQELYDYLSTL